ncbi:probable G-protein coupled receptor Mth-like 5 [Bactrocera neohumeralis]|uniref:probable G-protein coupled receptor Mth-like 5 n=1 Tax=Bactrocera neohumeralis TaxID=98809 RepID=UPI002165C29A|nr:probable G-protein coupled receptor Mth-like 5 [Bactrocera neohumeralis]XP_050316894.1 probable G-protein coupled receptor Mth-like 5 [Bactrocera neohumeralis]XP_050316895.1 probable G-protein coupled receptor Mth-like 5 [Bactrocera neohumeralis]XP_050316896.1 probable G-protein coupled receptor Mth-like 5 [Bactrocera neohumeralis]XP_050316897.1 probable G-protein coupled receptor Mth-like 5 [Bactrocera neohumeralis]XP_050316898.1 probable G-protein coupled receptor Mth-like 5 [Bactrocera n
MIKSMTLQMTAKTTTTTTATTKANKAPENMIKVVTRTPAAKATTTILAVTTTTTIKPTLSRMSVATNTTTDMHFKAANSERKRSCHTAPQVISCCGSNYQQNNDKNYQNNNDDNNQHNNIHNYQYKNNKNYQHNNDAHNEHNNDNNNEHNRSKNQLSQNNKNNHRNNYNLPPLFAFNRHLVHATFLLLVYAVCNCCAGAVGSYESLAYAPAEPRPLQRRHTTAIVKDNNAATDDANLVFVYKCCEKFEIHVDGLCTQVNESEYFQPMFTDYQGVHNVPVKFKFVIGIPACGTMQSWPIYHYQGSADQLVLLDDGKLRHYTNSNEEEDELYEHTDYDADLDDERKSLFHDYAAGQYCIDKAISTTGQHKQVLYANICLAKREIKWSDTTFLLRKVINPILHGISLILLLLISIIYFILPTLRDLVGNIITTIAVCMMTVQAADFVRIFTEFSNHVSFIVADIILYISLLGAFFWLNSFGYYIWKTFRSRNVFLRVTDGRKYCYYSAYAWGLTALMAALAVFAHFFLDADSYKQQYVIGDQQTIGWLGIWIFFAPIACIILINIFFYVTTLKLINRRNVYGRIQHKLRANFIMFSWMLLIMSIAWLFFVLSLMPYEGLLYAHILVNAAQAPLLLYICVLRQKHVTFLLKKSCCYNEPPSANDWGDEMHYMNCNDY